MQMAQRFFSPAIRRAACAALLVGAATGAFAYKPDSDAKEAFDRAAEFRKAQDYRSARVELMNAVAEDPKWGRAFVAQAEVALELFDPVAARAALEKAGSLGIGETETAHLQGHAYWLLGDLEQARDILARETIADKHRVYADRVLGRVYMDMGDTIAAETVFNRAIKMAPKDSKLWTEIARFRMVIANQGGAIEAADYALQLDPNNFRALELRGRLVRSQFGVIAALPWFERALQISPNDVPVLEEYGATLGEAGRYRDMLAQARKIISLDGNNPRAFYMQAVIAARAGNYELARRLIPRIGGNFGDLPGPRLLSAIVEYESGNWNQAADQLDKLVEEQPLNLKLRTLLARTMHKAGDHRGAWDVIAPIADRPDANSYTIILAGRILEALSERTPAAGRLDRAAFPFIAKAQPLPEARSLAGAADEARRNPRNAAAVVPYIRVLLANGNAAAAREEANRLLEGNAGVVEAQLVAGDVEMAAGNTSAAIAAFERARKIAFTSPTMLRLVSAYRAAGNNAAASKTISDFLSLNPDSLAAQRLWAFDLLDREQWKDAIAWLERARVRLGYNDAVLNANIARAYSGAGRKKDALREARLAYHVHPANIMATHVYGQMLLTSGKYPRRAYSMLRKANKIAPDRKDIAKDLAAAEKALEKAKRAG
jgi:cellulose synthase operon protein C